MIARPVPERDGRPIVGIDLGAGRAWSAAVAIWRSGRVEALAVAPGVPSLEAQERRDRVTVGNAQEARAQAARCASPKGCGCNRPAEHVARRHGRVGAARAGGLRSLPARRGYRTPSVSGVEIIPRVVPVELKARARISGHLRKVAKPMVRLLSSAAPAGCLTASLGGRDGRER